jgi:hypothetical protein
MKPIAIISARPSQCKLGLGIVLIGLSMQASGQDVAPSPPRILSDPTFLPAARQFVGLTEYSNGKSSGNVQDYLGTQQYSYDSRAQSGYQLLAYGITNRLSVGVSGLYVTGDTDYRHASGTVKSTSGNDSGYGVGATYRLLEQSNSPVSLDFSAVLRTGGSPLGANFAVGYQGKKFTFKGLVGANQFNGGNYTAQPEEVPAWLDASRRYFVAVQTQTRLTDSFSVNLSISYSMAEGSVAAIRNGTSYTAKFPDAVGASLALNYHFIANKLVGKVGYDFTTVGNTHDQFANPALDRTYDNQNASSLFAGLLYAF